MRRKARLCRNAVVIPHAQRAPAHAVGIAIAREREMMAGVEPAVVGVAQAVEFANDVHGLVLSSPPPRKRAAAFVAAKIATTFVYNIAYIETYRLHFAGVRWSFPVLTDGPVLPPCYYGNCGGSG